MDRMEVLRHLVEMFGRKDAAGEAPTFDLLSEALPDEARMKPKVGVNGFDKNMVGYKGIYVTMAANYRLGPGGWIEYPIFGKESDCTLASKQPGIQVDAEVVIYFPALHRATFGSGTGQGQDYGDACKAAVTTARKRALADIGIGWDGYTEHTGHVDPLDVGMQGRPPATTGQAPLPAPKQQVWTPPTPKPAPATFAEAANAATDPQAPVSGDLEAAFADVLALLIEDGLVANTEKGVAWFRARADDFGFFAEGGTGESKVKLIERMNGIHSDRLKKLHVKYKEVFGANEAGRRQWMKEVVGKESTVDCTTQERIRLLAELAELAKGRQ